jgi:uncharacterized protein YdhG (YjbR/CyaY superfamily)
VQSTAANVTAYLEQAPSERQAVLTRLRNLCLEALRGYEETMEYGMPCYRRNGTAEVAWASQKNYISLYILKKAVLDAHRAELVTASIGKGCIRFSKPDKLDFTVIEKLLVGTRESVDVVC